MDSAQGETIFSWRQFVTNSFPSAMSLSFNLAQCFLAVLKSLLSGLLSDSGHFTTQLPNGVKDFIDPFLGRLLDAIDVAGEKALVDADGAGHLGYIRLRKAFF